MKKIQILKTQSLKLKANQKGFTLLELLIVIAILAILTTVVVLVLNPAEYLAQSRDAGRLSDMDTLNKAMNLYIFDKGSQNMGSSSIVYVSIADTTSTCVNLGLPTLPTGYTYKCSSAASSTRIDGTGWIPLNFSSISGGSPISRLPIDPTNTTSTNRYYTYVTDGSNYVLKVQTFESIKYIATNSNGFSISNNPSFTGPYIYPNNWVLIPGNFTFGTSDFWVMKYDAKCVQVSNNIPLTAPDTGYHTYSNSGQPCTGSSYYIASTPNGYPIASISHNTALSYCTSLGAHLLTNDEYMTIVTNAANQNSNWSGGTPGTGYMYSGHNDNAPAVALEASPDDTQGYFGETNTGGNQKRTFTLSNNRTVWDFAGNVWQHVQRSVNNIGDLTTTMSLPTCSDGLAAWGWCQYGNSTAPYVSAWTSDVAQSKVGPSNTSWNSSQGMGQIYTYKNGVNQSTTVFIRGATWGSGSGAGPFALYLYWGTGDTSYNVGFRCAR